MRINYAPFLFGLLTILGMLFCNNLWPQTRDTFPTINLPLLHEDFSLYDFGEVRIETDKTEIPPTDITKRKFQPAKEIFAKDELHFADSIKSFWIKFQLSNNQSSDTTIAVIFPGAVSKAVLYKAEGDRLIQIGKTGFFIAVLARNVSYRWDRIDLPLKAHSTTTCFVQAILYHGIAMGKMPVLENFTHAETWAFNYEKEVERPNHLWLHFFTGIFFMFFVFGFIKYLVLGKDKAYLYFSLMGLFNALLTVSMSEYPPLELPSFENARGKELFDLLAVIAFVMQGLFILEILQLRTKYPRVTKGIKGYFFYWFLVTTLRAIIFFGPNRGYSVFLDRLDFYNAFLILFLFLGWVVYLATIRKGFYRFIFLGALTVSLTFIFIFAIRFFQLQYLLPVWAREESRGGAQHLMQLALFIDMCFYFTGLAYRDRQKERQFAELKQKETELEMQALRAQMNPHFIFNSLNSINMFILENNKLQASEYLSKFSRLVRLILQNSQEAFIPLEKELEALQLYLELESLRFDQKFKFKITVTEDVDTTMMKVPPLIIQPYTENAIWHGLMHKKEKGHLEIELYQQHQILFCKITDDGVGRKRASEFKSKSASIHKSMGMRITADRIAMLQQQNKNSITITDLVLADGTPEGTEVLIEIPVAYD